MASLALVQPTSVAEAVACLARDGARPIAGGTALVQVIKQRLHAFSTLISLRRVAELAAMGVDAHGLVVGAMAPLHAVAAAPGVRRLAPGLAETIRAVGNVRVRTMATLGGNLCYGDPHCDPPAALLALGAEVWLAGPTGSRRLPLDQFFVDYYETALQPGELLTHVRVPSAPAGTRAVYVRYTFGSEDDWPCVAVFAAGRPEDDGVAGLRVALVGTGPRPQLVGGLPERVPRIAFAEVAAQAAEQAQPVADLRGSEWYKREMVRVHTRRALERLAGAGAGP